MGRLLQFRTELMMLWRAFVAPETALWLKALMLVVPLYLLSPIDIIPDFTRFRLARRSRRHPAAGELDREPAAAAHHRAQHTNQWLDDRRRLSPALVTRCAPGGQQSSRLRLYARFHPELDERASDRAWKRAPHRHA